MEDETAVSLTGILEMLFHSGGQDLNDVYMRCDREHIYLGNGGYALVKFAIDDLYLKDLQCPIETDKRFYVLSQLQTDLENVLAQKCLCYITLLEGHVVGLIIYPRLSEGSADTAVILQHIKRSCQTVAQMFQDQFQIPVYGAISRIYFGPECIPDSYHRISGMLEYARFAHTGPVVSESEYTDREIYSVEEVLYDRETARQLASTIIFHDEAALRTVLQAGAVLTERLFPSMEYFWFRAQNILSFLFVELYENGSRQLPARGTELFTELHRARSLTDFTELLTEQLLLAMQSRPEMTERRIEAVCQYVQDHLADCNLSVSGIAQAFDVSQPYLSAQFRKFCSCNLSDYIHMCRTAQARILIESTDAPLTQIQQETGYSSLSTFYRCFKKYQGVAPGQIRKS